MKKRERERERLEIQDRKGEQTGTLTDRHAERLVRKRRENETSRERRQTNRQRLRDALTN